MFAGAVVLHLVATDQLLTNHQLDVIADDGDSHSHLRRR